MFQTLVLILCLPSLLTPSGLCVCYFVPTQQHSQPDYQPRPVEAAEYAEHTSGSTCRCDGCRAKHPNSPGEHRPPSKDPARNDECPTCPTVIGVSPVSVVIPADMAGVEIALVRHAVVADISSLAFGVRPVPVIAFAAEPSAYISHCALLI